MKKDRIPELHFYEWRLTAWALSETRDRLNATGRGIYRELLDQCYAQGKFPDDREWICRRCACTPEELEFAWPIIERHFTKSRSGEYRSNVFSDIVRREYFTYVSRQRKRRKTAWDKSREINDEEKVATSKHEASLKLARSTDLPNGNGKDTATQDNGKDTATQEEKSEADVIPINWKADDTYQPFVAAYRETGKDLLEEDFAAAHFMWRKLDFEQKVQAISGIRERLLAGQWDDPHFVPLPKNYLEKGEYKRKVIPRKARDQPKPAPGKDFVADVERVVTRNMQETGKPW